MDQPIDIPIEVKLVSGVRNCRTCQWFWGGIPPYGGFPVFDWLEDFPPEVRNQRQATARHVVHDGPAGHLTGLGQVDPGIMHGCRKAPIMTLGINPNMTAYFAGKGASQWSYPNFSNDARYAYYYRHHNVYQDSIGIDTLQRHVTGASRIVAEHDGELLRVKRGSDHRWALLTLQYDGKDEPTQIEAAWTDKSHFVVLVDRRFAKGETIAAQLGDIRQEPVRLQENATGYYQRFLHVLSAFRQRCGEPLASAELSISEDVCQHDLVSCASPGWSSAYDLPQERIAHNCVQHHAWAFQQLVQTNPAVIVLVGKSTVEMLSGFLGRYVPGLQIHAQSSAPDGGVVGSVKEVYQLLRETSEKAYFLDIDIDGVSLKSRILITPHFSYNDNFQPLTRFSLLAWQAFEKDFAIDAALLQELGCVQQATWSGLVPVRLTRQDGDSVQDMLSLAAWQVLRANYYDPYDMLASALQQEYESGRVGFDATSGRLKRTTGACHFCNNAQWQFPEGCAYGKDKEPATDAGRLEAAVRQMLQAE